MISPTDFLDLNGLRPPVSGSDKSKELGQEEFFELMLTQLKNQDPFEPMESGAFLGQIAQFGAVQGLADLNASFASLSSALMSNQALQGAGLIGRSVLTPSDLAVLEPDATVTGAVDLPTGTSALRIEIQDLNGQTVRQIDLGAQPDGRTRFLWGGETDSGAPATPGVYRIAARYFEGTGMQTAPVLIQSVVDSVSTGPAGLTVYLAGLGAVPLSAVEEIG